MATLKDHLHWYNITKDEACILFNKSPRTLRGWNANPPPWVINVLKLHIAANPVPHSWHGWRFYEDCLISPANQKYRQQDILASQYEATLARTVMGDSNEITVLKNHLKRQLEINKSTVVVQLKRDNETIKRLELDVDTYA